MGRTERRLLVTMPPRHGKSEFLSLYFPTWYLGVWPDRRVMLASYEASFAESWGRKSRDMMREVGCEVFGVRVRESPSAASHWEIEGREGGMSTAGVGGPLTGKGADLLIIDDPIKNAEEANSPTIREKIWDWYRSTAYTRLEPDGVVIVIQTRWHEDDLAGRVLRDADEGGEPWRVVNMPAIDEAGRPLWPERFPIDKLRRIERTLSPYFWSALYQQKPIREGRTEWPDAYFDGTLCYEDDWPNQFEASIVAIDPSKGKSAKAGDYSAIVFGGLSGGTVFVDADLARRPPSRIVEDGVAIATRYGAHAVGVESNAFQELLGNEFDRFCDDRRIDRLPVHLIDNVVNKNLRIGRIGPWLHNRRIRFRDTPGCRLLVSQLKEWPRGKHDDGPDAMEMMLRLLVHVLNHDGAAADFESFERVTA